MASMVFPAGSGRNVVSWLDKVASEEKKEKIGTAAISLEELKRLAAISDFVPSEGEEGHEEKESEGEKSEEEAKGEDEEDVKTEEAEEAKPGESPVTEEPVSEEKDGEEVVDVEVEAVDEAAAAVETAKGALEDASKALQDAGAKETSEVLGDVAEASLEETTPEAMDIEVVDEGAAPSVESVPPAPIAGEGVDGMSRKEEIPVTVEASSSRFYKIASLSPVNKKKLSDYWIKTLGYDSDWVKSLLKDYNK